MNIYTRWISSLLNIPLERALEVQDQMQIDFSECTKAEFNEEARVTYDVMIELEKDNEH
jgi:hypothetical protein